MYLIVLLMKFPLREVCQVSMTSLTESILNRASLLERDLGKSIEGMDCHIDNKVYVGEWSVREVLWHILEDPEGGLPKAVELIIDGTLPELTIVADETHLTPERESMDLSEIRQEIREYFRRLEAVLSEASDGQISRITTSCWFPLKNYREDRTSEALLEGLFLRHWSDHVKQLRALQLAFSSYGC